MSLRKAEILGLAVLLFAVWLIPGPPVFADSPENDYDFAKQLLKRARDLGNDEYLPLALEVARPLEGDRRNAKEILRGSAAWLIADVYETWFEMTDDQKWEKKAVEAKDYAIKTYPKHFRSKLEGIQKLFDKMQEASQLIADARDKEETGDKKKARELRAKAVTIITETQTSFKTVIERFRAEVDKLLPKVRPRGWRPENEQQYQARFKRNLAEFQYGRSYLLLSRAIEKNKTSERRKALEEGVRLLLLYIEGTEDDERWRPLNEGVGGGDARDGEEPIIDGQVKTTLGEVYVELAMIGGERSAEYFGLAVEYFDEVSWFTTNEPMNEAMEKIVLDINMQAYFRKAQAFNKQKKYEEALLTIEEMLVKREHKVCPDCRLWTDNENDKECAGYIYSNGNYHYCKKNLESVKMVKMFPMKLVRESLYGKQALFEQAKAYVATGEYVEGVRIAYEIYEAEHERRRGDNKPTDIEIESAKRMAKMAMKTQAVFPAKISYAIAMGFFFLEDERRASMAFKDVVSASSTEEEERKYAAPALFELGKSYYHQELYLLAYTAFIELATNHPKDDNAASASQFAGACISKLKKGEGKKPEIDPKTGDPIPRKGGKPEKLSTAHMDDLEKIAGELFGKLGQGVPAQKVQFAEAQKIQAAARELSTSLRIKDARRKGLDGDARKVADAEYDNLAKQLREKYIEAAKSFLLTVEVAEEKRGEDESSKKTPVPFYPNSRMWAGYCYMQAGLTYDEMMEKEPRAKLLAEAVKLFDEAIKKALVQKNLETSDERRRQLTLARGHLFLAQTHLDAAWKPVERPKHLENAINALLYFDSEGLPDDAKVVDYSARARLQQIYAYFPLKRYDEVEAVFAKVKKGFEKNKEIYAQYARISSQWLGARYISIGDDLVKDNKDTEAKKFYVKAADFLNDWREISEKSGKPLTAGERLYIATNQSKAGSFSLATETLRSFLDKIKYTKNPKTKKEKKDNALYLQAQIGMAECNFNMKQYLKAGAEYEWFKDTEWKDKIEVVEGRGRSYWKHYLESKRKRKRNEKSLGKAQLAYQALYRKTPKWAEDDQGVITKTSTELAGRHWGYFYQLLWIRYEKQDYGYIASVMGDYIELGELDQALKKGLVDEKYKKKFITLYERAKERTAKKKQEK